MNLFSLRLLERFTFQCNITVLYFSLSLSRLVMAKRIAEKELTDRNWDQEDEGEEVRKKTRM